MYPHASICAESRPYRATLFQQSRSGHSHAVDVSDWQSAEGARDWLVGRSLFDPTRWGIVVRQSDGKCVEVVDDGKCFEVVDGQA